MLSAAIRGSNSSGPPSEDTVCYGHSAARQEMQSLYWMRELCLQYRTAWCNEIRRLLAEYGVVMVWRVCPAANDTRKHPVLNPNKRPRKPGEEEHIQVIGISPFSSMCRDTASLETCSYIIGFTGLPLGWRFLNHWLILSKQRLPLSDFRFS